MTLYLEHIPARHERNQKVANSAAHSKDLQMEERSLHRRCARQDCQALLDLGL
jgi:hypothetical protein